MANTGFTLWFTGLSGAGKSTLSSIVEQRLKARDMQLSHPIERHASGPEKRLEILLRYIPGALSKFVVSVM